MTMYERKARQQGFKYIGGVDEAGRGPWQVLSLQPALFFPKMHISRV